MRNNTSYCCWYHKHCCRRSSTLRRNHHSLCPPLSQTAARPSITTWQQTPGAAQRWPINIPIAAARNNDFIKRRGQVRPDTRAVTLELCPAARPSDDGSVGGPPYIFSPLGPPFCFVFPAAAAAAAVRVAPFRGHGCRDPPVRLIDQTMPPLLGVINYPDATRDVRGSALVST